MLRVVMDNFGRGELLTVFEVALHDPQAEGHAVNARVLSCVMLFAEQNTLSLHVIDEGIGIGRIKLRPVPTRVIGLDAIPSEFSFPETALDAEVMRLERLAEFGFGLTANPTAARLITENHDGRLRLLE